MDSILEDATIGAAGAVARVVLDAIWDSTQPPPPPASQSPPPPEKADSLLSHMLPSRV